MDAVSERLERIEAKLDRVLNKPPPEIITIAGVMELTGCRSITAQRRWFRKHGVRPYTYGKYRRVDITNAISHAALFSASKTQSVTSHA